MDANLNLIAGEFGKVTELNNSGIVGSSVALGDVNPSALDNQMRLFTIKGLKTSADGENVLSFSQDEKDPFNNARDMDWVRLKPSSDIVGDTQVAGNDTLFGGDGDDKLYGQYGDDTLTGGAGADQFFYSYLAGNEGNDVITDFNRSEGDTIVIGDLFDIGADSENVNSAGSPNIGIDDLIETTTPFAANKWHTSNPDINQTITFDNSSNQGGGSENDVVLSFANGTSVTVHDVGAQYTSLQSMIDDGALVLTGASFTII